MAVKITSIRRLNLQRPSGTGHKEDRPVCIKRQESEEIMKVFFFLSGNVVNTLEYMIDKLSAGDI